VNLHRPTRMVTSAGEDECLRGPYSGSSTTERRSLGTPCSP
jgi:hypothetical protein